MPLIEVKLFDFRMDEETSRKLIAGLTDALCEATTEGLREHTWVVVEGHSPKNWGVGGMPWPAEKTPPSSERRPERLGSDPCRSGRALSGYELQLDGGRARRDRGRLARV